MTTRYSVWRPFLVLALAAGTLLASDTAPAAGDKIKPPVLISKPPLVYPAMAKSARASGPVVVKVRVGMDGRVLDAHATSGPFLLLFAAEESVRSWRYKPALLDKEPVEATTYVTLNFTYKRP